MTVHSTAGELSVPDIIQLAAMNRRSLCISVNTGDGIGQIYVQHGEVVHAAYGGYRGSDAFYALFESPHLGFTISNLGIAPARTIELSGQHLLLEAARRSDEALRSGARRQRSSLGSVTSRTQITSAPPGARRSLGSLFVPLSLLVSLLGMAALGFNVWEARERRAALPTLAAGERPLELAELDATSTKPHVLSEKPPKHPGIDLPLTPTIVLRLLVGADGKVKETKVHRPRPELAAFEAAAIRSAKQTVFKPATRAGKNMPVWLNFPISFVGAQPEKTLRIKGSETIGSALGPELASAYREHGGVPVTFEAMGSNTAFGGLFDGSAEIGASSRPLDKKELRHAELLGLKLQEFVIGYDGIAIVVHPDNPVEKLTLEQAARLFSGELLAWPGVGGQGNAVHPISRPSYSGTHGFFKERVLRANDKTQTREFAATTRYLEKNEDVARAVAEDILAIGYVGLEWVTPKVKAVPISISISNTEPAVSPTRATVRAGTYPLYRPLLMYWVIPPSEDATDFLRFVLSEPGQNLVEKHGFIRSDASPNALSDKANYDAPTAKRPKVFRVLFSQKSTYLDADAQKEISEIAAHMKRGPYRALIIGHSDSQGSDRANERHAALRAELIADTLERDGIARNLLRIEAASSAQPLAPNTRESGRDLNRRVDVYLVPR